MRRWGFSTHGSYPEGQGRIVAKLAPQAVRMNS